MRASKILLFPYWLTLKIRHRRYDRGRNRSYPFEVPVLCVGNVAVGGTGKTPMTEYLIEQLSPGRRIAVLSLGYKRLSRGFRMVEADSTAEASGDEPLQIKRKYPEVIVAVDRNRKRGIETLLALPHPPQLILLDDGLQRREIRPAKSLCLVDSARLPFGDELLPLGRLRDLPERALAADAVVFTRCQEWIDEADRARLRTGMHLPEGHPAFFTRVDYGEPKAVFEGIGNNRYIYAQEAILVAGVAHPEGLFSCLADRYEYVGKHTFADHHYFTRSDIRQLAREARRYPLSVVMTTEKDAQRLLHNRFIPDWLKERLYYLPIRTAFLTVEEERAFRDFLSGI